MLTPNGTRWCQWLCHHSHPVYSETSEREHPGASRKCSPYEVFTSQRSFLDEYGGIGTGILCSQYEEFTVILISPLTTCRWREFPLGGVHISEVFCQCIRCAWDWKILCKTHIGGIHLVEVFTVGGFDVISTSPRLSACDVTLRRFGIARYLLNRLATCLCYLALPLVSIAWADFTRGLVLRKSSSGTRLSWRLSTATHENRAAIYSLRGTSNLLSIYSGGGIIHNTAWEPGFSL